MPGYLFQDIEKKGDFQKAAELHYRNARNGDEHSIMELCYYQNVNRKIPCDAYKLESYVSHAVARHYGDAEYRFAMIYRKAGDWRLSTIYLLRALLDHCTAKSIDQDLAYSFLKGIGVLRNPEVAVDFYVNGIDKGNFELCLILGRLLATGEDGVQKNIPQAKKIFKFGVEHGVKGCQEELDKLQKETK